MASKKAATTTAKSPRTARTASSSPASADDVLALLDRKGSKQARDGLAKYGIEAKKAFGVSVATLRQIAKSLGPNHDLALALWKTEWYEARMLAPMIGKPERLTAAQMDAWCRDFDNWALVDTACFALKRRAAKRG